MLFSHNDDKCIYIQYGAITNEKSEATAPFMDYISWLDGCNNKNVKGLHNDKENGFISAGGMQAMISIMLPASSSYSSELDALNRRMTQTLFTKLRRLFKEESLSKIFG